MLSMLRVQGSSRCRRQDGRHQRQAALTLTCTCSATARTSAKRCGCAPAAARICSGKARVGSSRCVVARGTRALLLAAAAAPRPAHQQLRKKLHCSLAAIHNKGLAHLRQVAVRLPIHAQRGGPVGSKLGQGSQLPG